MLTATSDGGGPGTALLRPGPRHGTSWTSRLDAISLGLALVLGTAGLPHLLARFTTVPTARSARRSVIWAIGLNGTFALMTVVLGFGAEAILGPDLARSADAATTAVPLLALDLGGGAGSIGGAVLFAVICAVALATILAAAAGLTLASSASLAHDLWANVVRRGRAQEREKVGVARLAAALIGAAAIGVSVSLQEQGAAFLVGLAFAVAASAHLPVLLYTLLWRRFTGYGAVCAVYGGLLTAVLLQVFSPVVSGGPHAIVPGVDFHWFPLENPGIVSIPVGFLSGWLGTVRSAEQADPGRHAEFEVRALTGAGAA